MNGGRYIDESHVNELAEKETQAETSMKSMNQTCDGTSEDIEVCRDEHSDIMKGDFDDMVDACSEMMSDHMGKSSGMMGGAGMHH
jgi:hypothetical protein